jgi:hypothetical protein
MSMGTPEPFTTPQVTVTPASAKSGTSGVDDAEYPSSRFSNVSAPSTTGRMSDEDKAKLEQLQAQHAEDVRQESMPTEDNATHTVLLADGRVVLARSGAGTVYSENKDDGTGEKFTGIIGVYPR